LAGVRGVRLSVVTVDLPPATQRGSMIKFGKSEKNEIIRFLILDCMILTVFRS
jgi:hypothetical protein